MVGFRNSIKIQEVESFPRSFPHSLSHSPTHPLTHSLTQLKPPSLLRTQTTLTHSPARSRKKNSLTRKLSLPLPLPLFSPSLPLSLSLSLSPPDASCGWLSCCPSVCQPKGDAQDKPWTLGATTKGTLLSSSQVKTRRQGLPHLEDQARPALDAQRDWRLPILTFQKIRRKKTGVGVR